LFYVHVHGCYHPVIQCFFIYINDGVGVIVVSVRISELVYINQYRYWV